MIVNSKTKRVFSEEHKKALSKSSWNKGKHMSEEYKNKVSMGLKSSVKFQDHMKRLHSMPRTQKQIEQLKTLNSKPKTEAQILSCRKVFMRPKSPKQIEASRRSGRYVGLKYGSSNCKNRIREKHPLWRESGEEVLFYNRIYIYLDNHHSGRRYIRRSWFVVEKYFRFPELEEEVHHVDGNTLNDEIKNLILFSCFRAHMKFHKDPESVTSDEIIFDGRTVS